MHERCQWKTRRVSQGFGQEPLRSLSRVTSVVAYLVEAAPSLHISIYSPAAVCLIKQEAFNIASVGPAHFETVSLQSGPSRQKAPAAA